jgi:hypothetical protein
MYNGRPQIYHSRLDQPPITVRWRKGGLGRRGSNIDHRMIRHFIARACIGVLIMTVVVITGTTLAQ